MARSPGSKPPPDPFRWFDSSPGVIRLAVMLYVHHPLSSRNVEDLAHDCGIDLRHERVRTWISRFDPIFASDIRSKRRQAMRQHTHWR